MQVVIQECHGDVNVMPLGCGKLARPCLFEVGPAWLSCRARLSRKGLASLATSEGAELMFPIGTRCSMVFPLVATPDRFPPHDFDDMYAVYTFVYRCVLGAA